MRLRPISILSTSHPLCPNMLRSLEEEGWHLARSKDSDRACGCTCSTGTIHTARREGVMGGLSGMIFTAELMLACGCETKVSFLLTQNYLESEAPESTLPLIEILMPHTHSHDREPGRQESPFFDERVPMTVH